MRAGNSCDACGATNIKSFECQKCGGLFCPNCFVNHRDIMPPADVRQGMTGKGGMSFSHFPGKIGYTWKEERPQKARKKAKAKTNKKKAKNKKQSKKG